MIMHVVGNRPQFIKLAPLSRKLKEEGYESIVIHTGQHYDDNMSDIFFEELGIEKPFKNLSIGSGTHAETTGRAMIELEKVMAQEKPDLVLVYGDTNTTLAAAIAAAKLGIPIVHVEAGTRTFMRNNPEEINRKLVDHISSVLCCPDEESVDNLVKEGVTEGVYFTGDIMYDTFKYCRANEKMGILEKYHVKRKEYVLMTWHRQENTGSRERMDRILDFVSGLQSVILCPIHPRTSNMLKQFGLMEKVKSIPNLILTEPVGYMDMVALMNNFAYILCDSGGLSKESYYAGVKCMFMLNFSPWPYLVEDGNIITIDFDDKEDIYRKQMAANSNGTQEIVNRNLYYGNGDTADKIIGILRERKLIGARAE